MLQILMDSRNVTKHTKRSLIANLVIHSILGSTGSGTSGLLGKLYRLVMEAFSASVGSILSE